MAIAFVQSTLVASAVGFANATTAAITTVSGHLLVAHTANYTAGATVSDLINGSASGNTFTNVATFATGSGFIRMDYIMNCVGGANHTFTASGGNYPAITVQEFSGVALTSALDASGTDFVSGGGASHPVSCTTTNADDVVVGGGSSSNSTSFAVSSPFTQDRTLDTGTFEGIATGFRIVSATGSQTFTITTTNTGCTTRSIIAAFKAATGAPQPPIGHLTNLNQSTPQASNF